MRLFSSDPVGHLARAAPTFAFFSEFVFSTIKKENMKFKLGRKDQNRELIPSKENTQLVWLNKGIQTASVKQR